jgi:hypothetical protein
MPTPRYSSAAVAIGSKIYVTGGNPVGPFNTQPSSVTEVYDTSTDTWSTSFPIITPRWDAGAAVLGGRMLVVGGTLNGSTATGKTEALRP